MELNAVCPTSGQSRAREGAGPQAHACGSIWLVARVWVSKKLSPETLACIFRHLTAEARNRPAITSLRLLAVLKAGSNYARIVQETGRRAARVLS